ncbi:uncharacterized protein BO97DRAFT_445657 [Aspergillus homomorphus CBS 101889]|uniref:Uncharacterized protein n=1 Tax=Aspergillus homomorphus (strain CBS 101889) TaxID=1450537 RepID=A0A395HSG1_ASPHC|nr:hypothetical protein BO97DRAFT_445657 [Aspergillus homomorphus CBS 101889]RAL09174.1 hypothetical protein BO97DRAFT_445657 [Aspergillus homomorphus CBS 101889]
MVRLFQNGLASGLVAYALYQRALSMDLQEIDSYETTTTNTEMKIAVSGSTTSSSALDLQNQHSFFWGGGSETDILGNFTVAMIEDYETILAMEAFKSMIQNVTCTNGTTASVTVAFQDSASYTYAKNAWNWLNEEDAHYVMLVAGAGQCGWNTIRQPFIMTGASFRDNINTARFTGNVTEWQDSVRNYAVKIAKPETDSQIAIAKRGVSMRKRGSSDKTIDIEKDFSFSDKPLFDKEGASLSAGCSTCKTAGEFDLVFEYGNFASGLLNLFTHSLKGSATLSPKGVSAYIEPKVKLSGNLTKSVADELNLVTIPVEGINIPKIITIGPMVKVALGWSIGPIDGEATIGMGVEMDIKDSAKAVLNLDQDAKNEISFDQSGWSPSVTTKDFTLDAKLEANVEIYGKVSVELELEVFNHGWEAGVYLQPYVGADLGLEASNKGVCSKDSSEYHYAVEVTPSAGVNLVADLASASDEANPISTWNIASIATTLSEKCFGFDKITSTTTTTTTSKTTSTKETSSKETGSSSHHASSATSKAHPSSAAAHATSTLIAHKTSTHIATHAATITASPSHKSRRTIVGGHGRRRH